MWPNRSTVWSTTASTSAWIITLPATNAALSPAFISSSAWRPLSSDLPFTTTRAPSDRNASAMPRPIPRVPPVMAATLPSSLISTP